MRRLVSVRHALSGLVTLAAAGPGLAAERPAPAAKAQPEVVRLYEGPAPGSEEWKYEEKEFQSAAWRTRVVYNVVNPTLTVFRPGASKANGTAVVICPGGGFCALSIDREGNEVARWLADRGVTGFVLKYRLVPCKTDDPVRELFTRKDMAQAVAPVVRLAAADGKAAVAYVRKHAAEYGVRPDRVGILGFSAGGTVAASVAHTFTPETRPNFAAPIYLQYEWALKGSGVPADAPPLFLLAATDDQVGLAPHSVAMYQAWTKAKKSAELHLYSRGGHGFGMGKQGLPSDRWVERFADWLDAQGLLKAAAAGPGVGRP